MNVSARVDPPAILILGKLGDIINSLPIAWHLSQRFGAPVPMIVARRYAGILESCSYVTSEPWEGDFFTSLPDAIASAKKRHQSVLVLQTNGAGMTFERKAKSFCEEAYVATGLEGKRGSLPLVFDQRDAKRESAFLERVRNGSTRPLLLYNLEGFASPLPCATEFEGWLKREWGNVCQLWNLNAVKPEHFFDLLGLYEAAVGLITIDTATLHLAAATPSLPYIFFSPDRFSRWHASVPKGRCILEVQYGSVMEYLDTISHRIARMAGESAAPTRLFHSGDLGDIIYSLLFAKTLSPVHLLIGPTDRFHLRDPMTRSKFDWLYPLLRRQPWIKRIDWSPSTPSELRYDLNEFRKSWFSKANADRHDKQLWAAYQEHFGGPALDPTNPWIEADPAVDTAHPVVIARSTRWRNDRFPWDKIAATYSGRMVFVGFLEEYQDWVSRYGKAAEYRPVVDALDLANIISGAKLFIGNQSFACSLALALGTPTIQETCQFQADCVIPRPNAQYTITTTAVKLPNLPAPRLVTNSPGPDGKIELGPCLGAPGIGDTLMLTPVARAFGNRAVMTLPPSMARLSFLFRNICEVKVRDEHPVFPWPGMVLQSVGHLKRMGLSNVDPIPRIELSPEVMERARQVLAAFPNALAFCPSCSRHWARVRQRPPEWWREVITSLAQRYIVIQFGLTDYPTIEGAQRLPFRPLEELAAIYKLIGRYVGVNTGDYHLMVAVGGKAVVVNPDPWQEAPCWNYNSPDRIQYGKLTNPATVLEAMKRLGL